jgi:hypothetical protein
MKNNLLAIFAGMLYCFNCQAETTYTLEFAPNSPIKNVSLKNADLHIQLFANGTPKGFTHATTDENQSFTLKENEVFAILSIKDEKQHHARCSGNADWQNTKVQITCNKK